MEIQDANDVNTDAGDLLTYSNVLNLKLDISCVLIVFGLSDAINLAMSAGPTLFARVALLGFSSINALVTTVSVGTVNLIVPDALDQSSASFVDVATILLVLMNADVATSPVTVVTEQELVTLAEEDIS